ncbi:hypothetical protein LPJ53_006237, partial [Coemansia erecta]
SAGDYSADSYEKRTGNEKAAAAVAKTQSTHMDSHVNALASSKFLQEERATESVAAARNAIVVPGILSFLAPATAETAGQIMKATKDISSFLESRIEKKPKSAKRKSRRKDLLQIVSAQGSGPITGRPEARMYPGIRALVHLVTKRLCKIEVELRLSIRTQIYVYKGFDRKPLGSDDLGRIDLALMAADRDAGHKKLVPQDSLAYANIVGIIEAKAGASAGDELDALAQVYRYSRNIYYCQPNRRFVWGITVCGSKTRACLLLPDGIFTSASMDLHSSDGRKELVNFLVHMSTCAVDRLGYDMTIRYDERRQNWTADVTDDRTHETSAYLTNQILSFADGTFGRHRRMFGSVGTLDEVELQTADDPCIYVIKDTWAAGSSGGNDSQAGQVICQEASVLRHIGNVLGTDPELSESFPTLVSGGAVLLSESSGEERVYDTTDSLLAALGCKASSNAPRRTHVRLVMTPYAYPIQTLKSVDEFIIVMADVLSAYVAISRQCGILHRDISSANIMYTRDPAGGVHGVLVDFDYVQRGNIPTNQWPFTGLLPFLGIQDLRSCPGLRTVLDGCESLLYVLCWFGTIGLRGRDSVLGTPPISKWREGNMSDVATSKMTDLSTRSVFTKNVVRHFLPHEEYRRLGRLAVKLYLALFENDKLTCLCKGTAPFDSDWDESLVTKAQEEVEKARLLSKTLPLDHSRGWGVTDPFERRLLFAQEISKEFLKIILDA